MCTRAWVYMNIILAGKGCRDPILTHSLSETLQFVGGHTYRLVSAQHCWNPSRTYGYFWLKFALSQFLIINYQTIHIEPIYLFLYICIYIILYLTCEKRSMLLEARASMWKQKEIRTVSSFIIYLVSSLSNIFKRYLYA